MKRTSVMGLYGPPWKNLTNSESEEAISVSEHSPTIKLGALLWIEWEDAGSKDEWLSSDALRDWANSGQWLIENVGWVTHLDEQCLVLSGQRAQRSDTPQYAENMRIPRAMIRAVRSTEGAS